jgi:hypothetical protein
VQTIEEHEKSGAARQHLGPIEGRRTLAAMIMANWSKS